MAYRTESLETYLADASAGQPTPGGGSASALAGAVGVSMACMAANFTVGNERFQEAWPRVSELLRKCDEARDSLLRFVDDDVAAYSQVSAAYSMPRSTPEEKAARTAAIQEALKSAMKTPLNIFVTCADVLGALDELADLANPNLISDVGVAAALVLGALEGAELNVEINLASLKDSVVVKSTRALLAESDGRARKTAGKILDKVHGRIRE